jgi:hypothetical protein
MPAIEVVGKDGAQSEMRGVNVCQLGTDRGYQGSEVPREDEALGISRVKSPTFVISKVRQRPPPKRRII